jgi:hypothetical protein
MTKRLLGAVALALILTLGGAPAVLAAPDAKPAAAAPAAKADAGATAAPVATKAPPAKAAPAAKADSKPAKLPVVNPEDPVSQINFIIQAFKSGQWAWGIGLILMLLTLIFNKLVKTRIPKKVMPWIAIGLGVASNIAMSFATGLKWYQALSNGFTMGLAAVGGWEAIGKLFKKSEPAKPA